MKNLMGGVTLDKGWSHESSFSKQNSTQKMSSNIRLKNQYLNNHNKNSTGKTSTKRILRSHQKDSSMSPNTVAQLRYEKKYDVRSTLETPDLQGTTEIQSEDYNRMNKFLKARNEMHRIYGFRQNRSIVTQSVNDEKLLVNTRNPEEKLFN